MSLIDEVKKSDKFWFIEDTTRIQVRQWQDITIGMKIEHLMIDANDVINVIENSRFG